MYVHNINTTLPLWKEHGGRHISGLTAMSPRLLRMIGEFERALRGTPLAIALPLQARIRAVRGKQDLWHLRAEVYTLVRQAYDKWEAQGRLDELDELFDASHPRSPPAP